MFLTVEPCCVAPPSDASPAIPAGDLVAAFLTAEGLLFAALALVVALRGLPEGTYLPKFIRSGGLSGAISLVIGLVAVGAGTAWYDIYGAGFPASGFPLLAQSVALAVAISAPPLMACAIWRGSNK